MCSLQFIRFSQFDASASLIITHIFRISTMDSFVKLEATSEPEFLRNLTHSENESGFQTIAKIPLSACRAAADIEHFSAIVIPKTFLTHANLSKQNA